jgi:hypothetical protein
MARPDYRALRERLDIALAAEPDRARALERAVALLKQGVNCVTSSITRA